VAPSVTLTGPAAANEGDTKSYSYSWTDPGSGDTFPVAGNSVDCGPKGTASDAVFTPATKTGSFKCTFSDDSGAGTFAVKATVGDDDGGSGTDTVNVAVANVAPTIAFTAAPATANEGDTKTYNFSIDDPATGETYSFVTGYPTCGSLGTVYGTPSFTGKTGTFDCKFPEGHTGASSTVKVQVNDGAANSNELTQAVSIANLPPVVAKPYFQSSTTNCRVATTLTGISFTDPAGTNDAAWAVDINWGDGSTHTTFSASAQGAQPNQSHTYATPGPYTATVTVTDKDGALDNGRGSNSTNTVTIAQTYTTAFLQPLDGSSPSKLLGNTMKAGRIVPVKATLYDDCAQSYVTDPTKTVTIVVKDGGTGNLAANDAVEVYADAGASNSNTLNFRWTSDSSAAGGGFWIYNLDSGKAINNSPMVVGHNYNVDIFVGPVRATVTQWAILSPQK
jgi:hypothetical protein